MAKLAIIPLCAVAAGTQKLLLACLLAQLGNRSIYALNHTGTRQDSSVQNGSEDPFAGHEGLYEGHCLAYAYGPVDESGRWVCTESAVSWPMKWLLKKQGAHYTVTSFVDKTQIEHEGKLYVIPQHSFADIPMTRVYSDDYGHCVHMDAGSMYGTLRVRLFKEADDNVTVLQEEAHWHLSPLATGELACCPPRSAYVKLFCSPEQNAFSYKCTYYKLEQPAADQVQLGSHGRSEL